MEKITPALLEAAKTYALALAHWQYVTPIVEKFKIEALQKYRFRTSRYWVEHGDEDQIILITTKAYLLEDSDFLTYYNEYAQACRNFGFVFPEESAPDCIADNLRIEARRNMLKAAEYIIGIDTDEITMLEDYAKMAELVLGLVLSHPKTNKADFQAPELLQAT